MCRTIYRIVAFGLVTCLLVLSGSLYAQMARHAIHHAQHDASTHGSSLCAWMCAAGELHEGFAAEIGVQAGFAGFADAWALTNPPTIFSITLSSRAPPSLA